MKINNKDRIIRLDTNAFTNLDDESIVLNLSENTYHSLNLSGSIIWNKITSQGISYEDLIKELNLIFDNLNDSDIESINFYICELIEAGLVKKESLL